MIDLFECFASDEDVDMVDDLDLDHHRLLVTLGKSLSTCPQCSNNERATVATPYFKENYTYF